MEQHTTSGVSEFIKEVMPTATLDELRMAEMNLDRFLDVIDKIYARLEREGRLPPVGDKFAASDTLNA